MQYGTKKIKKARFGSKNVVKAYYGLKLVWEKEKESLCDNYLTIEALEDGLTASLSTNACQYSTDCVTWTDLTAGTTTPAINTGEKLYFKATGLTPTSSGIGTFTVNKNFNLSGNCMSMLFGDNGKDSYDLTGKNYAFHKLFYKCTTLKSVSSGFLPATTLATSCYGNMFYGCTNLTIAPELPATTLVSSCYGSMFYKCSKLNYIKAMFTTAPSLSYTGNWVYGVASTGTFVKNPVATWNVTGNNGVPSGWTVTTETESPTLISFTIDGISYQAEEGMTWGEWVNSEYNNDFYTDGRYIIENGTVFTYVAVSGTVVGLSDIISEIDYDIIVVSSGGSD